MKIKQLVIGDFVNYRKPSMIIAMPNCSFKCEKECGIACCQNSELSAAPIINTTIERIMEMYKQSDVCQSIVFGGLEPFDSWTDLYNFIVTFRKEYKDDIVIYTGYNKDEITNYLSQLSGIENIIIKFGRFVPNQKEKYDEILGIKLASPNQYAEVLQ